MNTRITRFAIATVLGLSATMAVAPFSQHEANATGSKSHPDFAWWPTTKPQGSRLFVGGLSMTADGWAATVQYNPKELSVDKQVPWQ